MRSRLELLTLGRLIEYIRPLAKEVYIYIRYKTMKRKLYRLKAGSLSNMKLIEENLPTPKANEVTVRVKSIGLNFADIFCIWGLYPAAPKVDLVPGLEYSGEIVAVGSEVKDRKVGEQIMGVTRFGAYATHLNIDERYVLPLPDGWNHEEGAAYLVQALTAYYGLIPLGGLQENSTVLIQSAAGGVGILANRIAKKYKAYTIGAVGRVEKVDFLQAHENYDQVIVRDRHFKQKLTKSLGGRELNLVMDSIGGNYFKWSYEPLAPMGRVVVSGSASYANPGNLRNYLRMLWHYLSRSKVDIQNMPGENKSIMGFNLIWLYERVELMREILSELESLNLQKPHVGHRFKFEELKDAILLFQTGKTVGKVVVNVV